MSKSASRGAFITLEGGEGAGKSTQAQRLKTWLGTHGLVVTLTREPGGSTNAECLRELLLDGKVAPFGADAEALVFAIARSDHVIQTIRPALARGDWVVCDRFIDSTRAYQGSAGVAARRIRQLELIAVGETMPDLTLILDLPAREGLARAGGRNADLDRFETDDLAIHEARRNAFLQIAAAEPERCAVIDALADEQVVFDAIKAHIGDRLGPLLPAKED